MTFRKGSNFSLIRHISVIFKNCMFHNDIQKEIELAKFSIQARNLQPNFVQNREDCFTQFTKMIN
jgi:hypothetical protein